MEITGERQENKDRKGQLWCHNIHFKETSEPLFVSKTSHRKPLSRLWDCKKWMVKGGKKWKNDYSASSSSSSSSTRVGERRFWQWEKEKKLFVWLAGTSQIENSNNCWKERNAEIEWKTVVKRVECWTGIESRCDAFQDWNWIRLIRH